MTTEADHPEVRRIFAGFDIEAKDVTYMVGGGAKAATFGEVIISN